MPYGHCLLASLQQEPRSKLRRRNRRPPGNNAQVFDRIESEAAPCSFFLSFFFRSHLRSSSAILLSLLDFLATALLSFCSWLSRALRMRSFIISIGVSCPNNKPKRPETQQPDKNKAARSTN